MRRHVDDLRQRGLYILTGSATPADARELHSGAGRISTLRMRPMSLYETGHSTGEIFLAELLRGEPQTAAPVQVTVPELMERIVIGGWPNLVGETEKVARGWLEDYLRQIVEVDVPSLGTARRSPRQLRRTLGFLGRSMGQSVNISAVAADVSGGEGHQTVRSTVYAYLEALDRLKLTEVSESWRPHMRSRDRLREAPVRYFTDPSLGTAALGMGSQDLLADIKAAGFHFEAMVVRDLRIYAQRRGGMVYSWREEHGRREVDAIVETPDASIACEVKLTGDQTVIDKAARGLLDFAADVDQDRHGVPGALVVITAVGGGGLRPDGVHVVPITALGP